MRGRWQICAHKSGQILNASKLGAENDLVLTRGKQKHAVGCKASAAPKVSLGFWSVMEDLEIENAWATAPCSDTYSITRDVTVSSLENFNKSVAAMNSLKTSLMACKQMMDCDDVPTWR